MLQIAKLVQLSNNLEQLIFMHFLPAMVPLLRVLAPLRDLVFERCLYFPDTEQLRVHLRLEPLEFLLHDVAHFFRVEL